MWGGLCIYYIIVIRSTTKAYLCVSECLHPAVCLTSGLCLEIIDSVGQAYLEGTQGVRGPVWVRGLQLHHFLQVYLIQLLSFLGERERGREREREKERERGRERERERERGREGERTVSVLEHTFITRQTPANIHSSTHCVWYTLAVDIFLILGCHRKPHTLTPSHPHTHTLSLSQLTLL